MLEIKVKVEIYCTCGAKLNHQYYDTNGNILVGPCEKCLAEAQEESYDQGHEAGYAVGYDAGIGG